MHKVVSPNTCYCVIIMPVLIEHVFTEGFEITDLICISLTDASVLHIAVKSSLKKAVRQWNEY